MEIDSLDAAQKRIAELEAAHKQIIDIQPCQHEGSTFYPEHDGDGNWMQDVPVDPIQVIQSMVEVAEQALKGGPR